ncbi:hypothetical protein SAMN05216532_3692 [Streptomyces sp. 2231.1]|nr:hypothetical protein SAMN05216532_3692 [Streptomyces sp. 2231.1]
MTTFAKQTFFQRHPVLGQFTAALKQDPADKR